MLCIYTEAVSTIWCVQKCFKIRLGQNASPGFFGLFSKLKVEVDFFIREEFNLNLLVCPFFTSYFCSQTVQSVKPGMIYRFSQVNFINGGFCQIVFILILLNVEETRRKDECLWYLCDTQKLTYFIKKLNYNHFSLLKENIIGILKMHIFLF